jgi:microcystin degradation protein MlrC
MKILFAGLFHETHCFVSDRTPLGDFRRERGDEIFRRRVTGRKSTFLEVAGRAGWTVLPARLLHRHALGIVTADVFRSFWSDVAPIAEAAARSGVDGISISLHGAMVTEAIEDVEGELLARLRSIGMRQTPIFGVFDLHANFTGAMARHANGLVCYREIHHIDARVTAIRAAELLERCLASGVPPRMVRLNPPIVWPPTGTGTADSPMRDLEALARRTEVEDTELWAVNVVAGFSFADVEDAGVSFSVVTTGPEERARSALERLASMATDLRDRGYPAEHDPIPSSNRCPERRDAGPFGGAVGQRRRWRAGRWDRRARALVRNDVAGGLVS